MIKTKILKLETIVRYIFILIIIINKNFFKTKTI